MDWGKRMKVLGIDPGTGLSSPLGLVFYDHDTGTILWYGSIGEEFKKLPAIKRIQKITRKVVEIVDILTVSDPDPLICIENFVMRGKGGETLQMLIGAIISQLPQGSVIIQPYNTSVKKAVGGTGKADKLQVAQGVRNHFSPCTSAVITIDELIAKEAWDILDALAIGITGAQIYEADPKCYQG